MEYIENYLKEVSKISMSLDANSVLDLVNHLIKLREQNGRLFFLGVGGSAGNCSHAVNDFRKIVGIEAYAPTDNVSELTARTNDEGWSTTFVEWLKVSKLNKNDSLFVFSVGGGDLERNISPNLVNAVKYAKEMRAGVLGIVGRDGGYTASEADCCIIIPTVNSKHVTPHSESFQSVIWHLIVSHPSLKLHQTKWEDSTK